MDRKKMHNIDFESGAVQSYLGILQGVINRMASNCASCKTWCITLVSAMTVVIADKSNPSYIWVAMVPILLFLFLDGYYLGLEQRFRESYNMFIRKLHSGEATIEDVYIVNPGGGSLVTVLIHFKSYYFTFYFPFLWITNRNALHCLQLHIDHELHNNRKFTQSSNPTASFRG